MKVLTVKTSLIFSLISLVYGNFMTYFWSSQNSTEGYSLAFIVLLAWVFHCYKLYSSAFPVTSTQSGFSLLARTGRTINVRMLFKSHEFDSNIARDRQTSLLFVDWLLRTDLPEFAYLDRFSEEVAIKRKEIISIRVV